MLFGVSMCLVLFVWFWVNIGLCLSSYSLLGVLVVWLLVNVFIVF